MTYVIMLTGAGPTRAFAERVTHVVYLASIFHDVIQVLPFDDLPHRLQTMGRHHTTMQKMGNEFVSISIPHLPRNFVDVGTGHGGGCFFPLDAHDVESAREALIAWCERHAA